MPLVLDETTQISPDAQDAMHSECWTSYRSDASLQEHTTPDRSRPAWVSSVVAARHVTGEYASRSILVPCSYPPPMKQHASCTVRSLDPRALTYVAAHVPLCDSQSMLRALSNVSHVSAVASPATRRVHPPTSTHALFALSSFEDESTTLTNADGDRVVT